MGILYRKRTLVGNISLVVFLAFLVTLTLGMFPGNAAASITPTLDNNLQQQTTYSEPVKVIDKNGAWQGGSAVVQTNSDATQVTLTVQVLTQNSFNSIILDLVGVGTVQAQNVTSATYKTVYGTAYSVYQLIYTWVYSAGLSVGSNNDYTFIVYSNSTPLASITLDLETPPPSGGGGGGGGTTTTTTTTTTDTGTVTTTGGTATLTTDPAKIDGIIADPNATQVVLDVPAAGGVNTAVAQVTVEQLTEIFAAGKDVVMSFGGAQLTFAPGTIDLSAFGPNATVSFEISKVPADQVSGTTGTTLMIAGEIYNLNVRVLVDGVDKGGIHSFSSPVTVNLPYDPAKLGGAPEDSLGVYRFNETTQNWDYVGGQVDKDNNTVGVTLNSFSKYAVMAFQKTFADLAGHWAKAEVELMAARHVVYGVTDTSFGPELNVTRAQFVAFLQRALMLAEDKGSAGRFPDVQQDEWFAGAVGAAVKAGVVNGYGDGTFCPEQLITREEIVVMVTRALAYSGINVAMTPEETAGVLAVFSDAGAISGWARESAAVAVKYGICSGRSIDSFVPGCNATRAEAVAMLKRMLTATGVL